MHKHHRHQQLNRLGVHVIFTVVLVWSVFIPTHAEGNELKLVPIIENLSPSWAVAVSPSDEVFISGRAGVIEKYTLNGELVKKYPLPLSDLFYEGQGGLLDIAFAPDYLQTGHIYASYSYGTSAANALKVVKIDIRNANKPLVTTIFAQRDMRSTPVHYGARMAFMNNGNLLLSTGDGFDFREDAQRDASQLGKILNITPEGEIITLSKGHRNPQGLIVMPNGQVLSHEHGPDGGDELNIIELGNNYGWPVITNGKDYIGGLITPFTEYPKMQQPAVDWTPSIAPSGMIYYANTRLPTLSKRLLITSLKYQQLHTLAVTEHNGELQFTDETVLFPKSGYRMRDIAQTSEGRIFILGDGKQANLFELTHSD
ncbi:MAG: PQQ-dependent sugar dehydrogenase [Glaciecola sp.]